MPFTLVFPEQYQKIERRFFRRHPDLMDRYEKTLKLLEVNPFHPSLRLHKLSGRLEGLHSVAITVHYRITVEFLVENDEIVLVSIGGHDAVY